MRLLGVDIGGSKLALGTVQIDPDSDAETLRAEGMTVLDYHEQPLPDTGYEGVLATIAAEVCRRDDPPGVDTRLGVGVAGWLTADRETVVAAVNLGWWDCALRRDLSKLTGLQTTVHNDGNAAAWGEYLLAGGRAQRTHVVLTLGTDVGGGIVAQGRLLTGAFGLAGELGHLRATADGPVCVCGARGCLAVYASGTAMLARARAAVRESPERSPWLTSYCQGDPDRLRGADLAHAADEGDPAALEVVALAAQAIGNASSQLTRVIDHDELILGGGASAMGETLRTHVELAIGSGVPVGPVQPRPLVRLSQVGNRAGVLGAAHLAAHEPH